MIISGGTICCIFIAFYSVCTVQIYASQDYKEFNDVEDVYPRENEELPILSNFNRYQNMQFHSIEYPTSIEAPYTAQSMSKKLKNTSRGKVYAYNIEVPPTDLPFPNKVYNYIIDVPSTTDESIFKTIPTHRLKGFKSRIDKVFVPEYL